MIPIYLFTFNSNYTASNKYNKQCIKYCKIYNSDVLVRNFIPCYRKSDSVAGMYDTVNGVFYTNQGTGSFVVGNNVYGGGVFTVPEYIPNGYVNHIRGTATADFDFTLKYIDDKTNAITTVTEHAVIDGNGHWDVKYEGKKIKELLNTFKQNTVCKTIQFTEGMTKCTSMYAAFYKSTIISVDLLAATFDELTDMRYMCAEVTAMTECKLRYGNKYSKVHNWYGAFCDTDTLKDVEMSCAEFDSVLGQSVGDLLFRRTKAMKVIDLRNCTFGNVSQINSLCMQCSVLEEVNLHNATFANTTVCMSYLCGGNSNLKKVDLSSFDATNVTETTTWFINNTKMTDLLLPHNETLSVDIDLHYSPLNYESMQNVAYFIKNHTNTTYVKIGTRTQAQWNAKTVDWYTYGNNEYIVATTYDSSAVYYTTEIQTVTFKTSTYNALTQEQKNELYDIIHTQKNWNLTTA